MDSLNMLPAPLASLPKSLGFSDRVKKGFFPYDFVKEDTLGYVGPIPSKEYFGYDTFTEAKKQEFDLFYDEYSNRRDYNLTEEMRKY